VLPSPGHQLSHSFLSRCAESEEAMRRSMRKLLGQPPVCFLYYTAATRPYRGLTDLAYLFHDWTAVVTPADGSTSTVENSIAEKGAG
jgi:hypothetical protein